MAARAPRNRPRSSETSASRIAGAFLRAAMGPIEYAGGCILGNRIQAGLEELGPDGLRDAYFRGIGDVASMAGVKRAEVERIVPAAEVATLHARLHASHARAVGAWKLYAGQFGFLDVVTALTVDGSRPDIGLCLERVAGKVRHDPELAEPLAALSIDIGAWAELVQRTEAVLRDLSWLGSAMRRRAIKRISFGVVALVTLFTLTGAIVGVRLAHDAVEARIAAVSNCDAEKLTDADLSWANGEQRIAVQKKVDACATERTEEERRRLEEEAAKEQERKAREVVVARERACSDLATEVEKGALDAAGKTTAGDTVAFLERVAKKTLEPTDVGPDDPKFPCGDVPDAKKRLETTYKDALLVDPMLWARRSDPSAFAQKILSASKDGVAQTVLIGLADNAERTATAGLTAGDKEKIARAKRLCAFATALGVSGQKSCRAVETFNP